MSDLPSQPQTPASSAPAPVLDTAAAEQLAQFLRDEIRKTQKSVFWTFTSGILLSLFIAATLGYTIYNMHTRFLDPLTLASFIGESTRQTLPGLIQDTEADLAARAQPLAETFSKRFMKLVPEFRAEGEKQLELAHKEMIPELSKNLASIITDYINTNAQPLGAFAKDHDDEEFTTFFVEALMEEFNKQLDAHLALEYEGRSVSYFKENLSISILAIDETLNQLLNADPEKLDRRQRLQRKLLARLFVSALNAGK